jgi:Ras-related protein Rab-8A
MAGRTGGYDVLLKLLIVGNSGVGKSCLLLRFADASFTSSFITTIGIDFKIKTVLIDGVRVKFQIWDTAGQERFRTIVTAYYRGAQGVLLVYDVTDAQSFRDVRGWSRNVDTHGQEGVYRLLVGNKCDSHACDRQVSEPEGRELGEELGIKFFEASAKANVNVDAVFETAARDLLTRRAAAAALPPGPAIDLVSQEGRPRCCQR